MVPGGEKLLGEVEKKGGKTKSEDIIGTQRKGRRRPKSVKETSEKSKE